MMLGDLMAAARGAALIDPDLSAELAARGADPAHYAARALTDFERHADEEDWATLISAIRRAPDPAAACLEAMVRWRLEAPTCAQEGHAP